MAPVTMLMCVWKVEYLPRRHFQARGGEGFRAVNGIQRIFTVPYALLEPSASRALTISRIHDDTMLNGRLNMVSRCEIGALLRHSVELNTSLE